MELRIFSSSSCWSGVRMFPMSKDSAFFMNPMPVGLFARSEIAGVPFLPTKSKGVVYNSRGGGGGGGGGKKGGGGGGGGGGGKDPWLAIAH